MKKEERKKVEITSKTEGRKRPLSNKDFCRGGIKVWLKMQGLTVDGYHQSPLFKIVIIVKFDHIPDNKNGWISGQSLDSQEALCRRKLENCQ